MVEDSPGFSVTSRRRAGVAMQAAAIIGVAAAIVGTIAAWYLAGRLERTVDETLGVTQTSLITLDQTITVADEVISTTEAALVAAASTLEGLVVTVDSSTQVIGDLDAVLTELAPALDATIRAVRDTADAADAVDSVLRALDSVPFAPSYEPDEPFGATLRSLADDIEPLAAALGSGAESLGRFDADVAESATDLSLFAAEVRRLSTSVGEGDRLLDSYRATTANARVVAEQTEQDLARDVVFSRVLIVVVGLALAVAQIVPYWIGRELMNSAPFQRPLRVEH